MSKNIRCSVCKNNNITHLEGVKEYNFCNKCNTAWLKKISKPKYNQIYYKGKSGLASVLFVPFVDLFYKLRKFYVRTNDNNLWIDLGAGDGSFLETVNYKQKIGIELSSYGRALMEKRGLKTLTNEHFLKKSNLKADVISFWHVLEHLENPSTYLRAASKNISKKGTLIIGIPNIESFEFKFFKRFWFHLAPLYHIWHFSPKSIKLLLEQNDFKIEYIDYWAPEHHFSGFVQSMINKTSGSENILHKLVKRQDKDNNIPVKAVIISTFWLTLGMPLLILFWIVSSFTSRSGAIVVVASPKKCKNN